MLANSVEKTARMVAWKITFLILVVLATSHCVLGSKVAQGNNITLKAVQQLHVPNPASVEKENLKSKLHDQVCAKVCVGWFCTTSYCQGNEVCCKLGDPMSNCCPAEFPVCATRSESRNMLPQFKTKEMWKEMDFSEKS